MNEKNEKENETNEKGEEEGTTMAPDALAKVTAERDEYLQGWQRAKADFANAKKRMEESMSEYRTMANEGLIEELLPVLSSFEMAFSNKEAWEKIDKNWRMGVEHIYMQLKGILNQNGLKEVDPMGTKFDPNLHEAVRHEPSSNAEENTIIQVLEKGYTLGTKLIRPAKVVVAEHKE